MSFNKKLDNIDITKENKARIRTIHKYYFPNMSLTKNWMNKNLDLILKTIDENYSVDKPSSRCSYYSSLSVLAKQLGGEKDKAYQKFSKLSTDYAVKHREKRETGELSEAEKKNLHSYESYSIHREIAYQAWQDDKKNEQKMYRSLIMSMLTLYVPLRRADYLKLRLIKELPKETTTENFLLYHEGSLKCSIVLNKPAKSKKHELAFKAGTYPLNLMLSKRIIESIAAFKRTYLFSMMRKPTKSMSEGSFYKILDGIYKTEVVRASYVRTAYETFVSKQDFSTAFRKNISKLLLHDLATALSFYQRIKIKQEPENEKYKLTLCLVETNGNFQAFESIGDAPDYQYEYVFLLVGESKPSTKKLENLNEKLDDVEEELDEIEEKPVERTKVRLIFDDDDDEPVVNNEPIPEPIIEQPKVNFERAPRQPLPPPLPRKTEVTQKSEPLRKHNKPNPKQKVKIRDDDNDDIAPEQYFTETAPKKPPSKNSVAVAKYLAKDGNRRKHQAIDYCSKLNKGIISNPKQATIEKYDLVFEDGKYRCK